MNNTKRPWTPGPWDFTETPYSEANTILSLKAPDMAELLIRLVEGSTCVDINTFHDLLLDAAKILKEIGYEPEQD